ncbi:hypothetical protein LTR10_020281 [Elasticomyces elasticus]|uniref:L-ornithine N(5)-oxygenase n=1 Tax=Exophiala sideris TaxID=1016849 RepID=A0ABR0IVQ2_9EURO|nr:hypothetical protein LTR10_020281 [Elasticomyces elasticus]KAK5021301.1 hypothetical protein LTS07_011140 [Exophiala sideris]KAK5024228.1 hypothetical protein LTR13_010937 [Exophiala sideris]KAK5049170.1 hypothetical protein LTR69_011134 [Exophiala sideris]KAK5176481.1 hypothetical protein LTR44_010959 [Eurotiomycetes sp. CCFEE 6388]
MAHGRPREIDTVIVGNGPSALILSYILHGNIPLYNDASPHPDRFLHEKLLHCHHGDRDLLDLDIDDLTEHFAASRFSYSTQALPVNVLLDTLVRPLGETDDTLKKTCVKWRHDPARAISHLVIGSTKNAGGQWVDNPVHASWDIGTLSYAGMISLPGYDLEEHYRKQTGQPMPLYLRPSRRKVADYLAAYADQVGIADSVHNGQHVTGIRRQDNGFYISSHNTLCKNLVLASGIFDILIPPPPTLEPLKQLGDASGTSPDPILVIGSGFSAADVIISTSSRQKIIHVYKWAPTTSPSPLRACHQQAYPEYAGVYRRMKLAALSSSSSKDKRMRPSRTQSDFDTSRDWKATYEGLANAEIVDVQLTEEEGGATVTFRIGDEPAFARRVSSLAYVVGRRGSLDYLSDELLAEVLPITTAGSTISGQTLREKAHDDLELAPNVFIIGSLTGDSLIRFAYGGCAYAAGKIMRSGANLTTNGAGQDESNDSNGIGTGRGPDGVPERMRSRPQTPSPRVPAMNGLDGHEASPLRLGDGQMPLDRRKDES